jgi:TonB family protein
MSRIKPSPRHTTQAPRQKAALLPALAFALIALTGCTQTTPINPFASMPDNVTTAPVANFKSCAKPVYPPAALAARIEGTVTLGLLVTEDGKVRESVVRHSSGNASLDETARSALAKCRFEPGTVNGSAKIQWTELQYVWKAPDPASS